MALCAAILPAHVLITAEVRMLRRLLMSLFLVVVANQNQGSNPPVGTTPKTPVLTLGLVKTSTPGTSNPNIVPDGTAVESLVDASPDEIARTVEAFSYANKVLASPEFRQAVLNMNIPGCFQKNFYESQFVFSNEAVYNLLVSKSPVQLNVVWYDGQGDNQGYEVSVFPNTVGANRNAVQAAGKSMEHPLDSPKQKEAGFIATLLLHESSHVIGFRHNHCMLHGRENSIPYVMNSIYWNLAPTLYVPQQSIMKFIHP